MNEIFSLFCYISGVYSSILEINKYFIVYISAASIILIGGIIIIYNIMMFARGCLL